LLVQFLIELVGTLRNDNQLELVLKIMKVGHTLCCFSAKELHRQKSLSCLEFGDVVITRRLTLAEY
jgi:hypothetical protein